jgi:hypothetical protein
LVGPGRVVDRARAASRRRHDADDVPGAIIQSNSGTATSSGRAGNGIEREVDDDEEAETDGELESRGRKEGLKEDEHLEGVVGKGERIEGKVASLKG